MTTKEIIAAFEGAVSALRDDQYRRGNVIELPARGSLVMTGDLHGNERNFERLLKAAKLDESPDNHLVLHEILHKSELGGEGCCDSYQVLAEVAKLKTQYPDQLHVILGNHAMAQVTREEVIKGGKPMVKALLDGIHAGYPSAADHIIEMIDAFIMNLPIAVRTQNKIWMSHSLPSARHLADFDDTIFIKTLTLEDMRSNTSLHALTWDRSHKDSCIKELQDRWQVETFVIGHKPQAEGKSRDHDHLIVLASDHTHGCYLPFDLKKTYDPDSLYGRIRPLAEIA